MQQHVLPCDTRSAKRGIAVVTRKLSDARRYCASTNFSKKKIVYKNMVL